VSVGLLAGGELSLIKCGLYILAQCVGATLGAGVLYGVTPEGRKGSLAANGLGEGADAVHPAAGILLEAVLFATAVDSANKISPGLAPLLIGLTVTAAHLVCIPYTGTSINPARSLGPVLVTGTFDINHWVFWVGPLVGGVLGGVIYTFVFRNNR
jgi:glycerol uptake facilitator-like aquaporin